jgi:hypothetical protein
MARRPDDPHSLQGEEYDTIWWLVPLDDKGKSGVDRASIHTARALLRRVNRRHHGPVGYATASLRLALPPP